MEKPEQCELCNREVTKITKHHLIPKSRHRNKKNRKNFTREDVRTRVLWICRPCHTTIHNIFTIKELEYDYNTKEKILENEEVVKFIEWVKKQPDTKIHIAPKKK